MTKRSKRLVANIFTHFSNFDKLKEPKSEVEVTNLGVGGRLYTPDSLKEHAVYTHSRIQASGDPYTHSDIGDNPAEGYLPHQTEDGEPLNLVEVGTELDPEWEQTASEVDLPLEVVQAEEDEEGFLDLVDVDGTSDESVEDVLFASVDGTLLAIKGSRVIAEMTEEDAKANDIEDIYEEDTFAEAVEASMKRAGLRAGLTAMGFKMAKVNLRSSRVLTQQVNRMVAKRVRGANQDGKLYAERFAQSLAIASSGIAAGFFKGDRNLLAERLIANLENSGVRGAARLVHTTFAQEGVSYCNMLMLRAQKLMSQSDEVRNGFAEALDMVEKDQTIESLVTYEDEDATDFVDATSHDLVPEEITAALSQPTASPRVQINAALKAGTSQRALDLLNSSQELNFV